MRYNTITENTDNEHTMRQKKHWNEIKVIKIVAVIRKWCIFTQYTHTHTHPQTQTNTHKKMMYFYTHTHTHTQENDVLLHIHTHPNTHTPPHTPPHTHTHTPTRLWCQAWTMFFCYPTEDTQVWLSPANRGQNGRFFM